MKIRKNKLFIITFVACCLLISSIVLTSCDSGGQNTFKNALIKTIKALENEFTDMAKENVVLKTMSDLDKSAYQLSVEIPETLIENLVSDMPVLPTKYVVANDRKNQIASLTTSFAGKRVGLYVNKSGVALDFLSNPIVIENKTAIKDIEKFLEANNLSDDNLSSVLKDLKNIFSYNDLLSSGSVGSEADDLKKIWDKLKLIESFIDNTTCTALDPDNVEIQEKSVKADVIKVSMKEKDFFDWYKDAVKKMEKNKDLDGFIDMIAPFATLSGMSEEDFKEEFYGQLNNVPDSANFSWIEEIYLKVYIYKGLIVKFEVYDDFHTMHFSLGFLGDNNLTDKIELSFDGGSITAEGNLIPINNNISYKITVKEGFNNTSINVNWDLSASTGKNFTISGTSITNFSMFFGIVDKNSVKIDFDVEVGSYWYSSKEPIRILMEPLNEKITFPSKNSINIKSLDINDLVEELGKILG